MRIWFSRRALVVVVLFLGATGERPAWAQTGLPKQTISDPRFEWPALTSKAPAAAVEKPAPAAESRSRLSDEALGQQSSPESRPLPAPEALAAPAEAPAPAAPAESM